MIKSHLSVFESLGQAKPRVLVRSNSSPSEQNVILQSTTLCRKNTLLGVCFVQQAIGQKHVCNIATCQNSDLVEFVSYMH